MLEFSEPGRLLPVLPPKNPLTTLNLSSDQFLAIRHERLNVYLHKILESSALRGSEDLYHFVFSNKKSYALYMQECKERYIDV